VRTHIYARPSEMGGRVPRVHGRPANLKQL
jgi:hypothetical protein